MLGLALTLLLTPPAEHQAALTPAQAAQVEAEGFVVLPGAPYASFADVYADIYEADRPVFITADSLLHAQHRSFDRILEQIERDHLIEALDQSLAGLHAGAPAGDLDLYLAVARSLLAGERVPPRAGGSPDFEALMAAAEAQRPTRLQWWGSPMDVDLSLLKPRGHYAYDEALGRYFKAMSWLGAAPLRVVERGASGSTVNRAALEAALTLADLAQERRTARALDTLEGALSRVMGEQDSVTLADLRAFQRAAPRWRHLSDPELLTLVEGQLGGASRARAGLLKAETLGEGLPVDVRVLGPRWTFDAELLSEVTHPSVDRRLMPSGLDVLAGLGSAPARELLASERARYGYDAVLDSFSDEALVPDDLYHAWLATIAALDDPVEGALPAPMRSEGWSLRLLEAQLASWAELRRDTILYAQHTYSGGISCEFPHAYVEPAPAFFEAMLRYDALLIELAEHVGAAELETWGRRVMALHGQLAEIVDAQLAQRPLSPEQRDFLRQTIEKEMVGCGEVALDGWYPELYLRPSDAPELIPSVADVHTAPTDLRGAPTGDVLHQATWYPRTLMVVIDGVAYYGPASTWTEFTLGDYQRLTDPEWGSRGAATPRPAWTLRYAPAEPETR